MSSRDAAVPCKAQGGTFPKQAQSRIAVTQAGGGKSTFKALESFFSVGNKNQIMGERRQGTAAWQDEPCASAEFLAGLFWGLGVPAPT